ncbi:HlyD family secretion protein [Flagellimonas maritima]|nr:HlyD family efflux transporter periplasmic adaptor subunit [Allomuricauda aurantiaca]
MKASIKKSKTLLHRPQVPFFTDMNYLYNLLFLSLSLVIASCGDDSKSDAYGNFEATTVTVSAKGNGELLKFGIEEGDRVEAGQQLGLIDTTQRYLEKVRLKAQLNALNLRTQEAGPEIAILQEDLKNLQRERDRTQRLFAQKAATQKQLDDYEGRIGVVQQQIASARRSVGVANRGVLSEEEPLKAQIQLIEKQIKDCKIINPLSGTILTTFAEPSELVSNGSPLYKVANLDTLKLKAYTSATILQNVKLNDRVTVLVDEGEDSYKELNGTVTWIASEAEFTPKTIETKEERVNLVYAIEVSVPNDGYLKIGMPGEVVFQKPTTN